MGDRAASTLKSMLKYHVPLKVVDWKSGFPGSVYVLYRSLVKVIPIRNSTLLSDLDEAGQNKKS